ncbi:ABC transporter permease [Bacillus safensis FO-36b]|uniref:ABC transporter permease n=1 Tax=Bacillus TaxID=1386 RepID=UPI00045CC81E|nr:ABC transporter permease [Bacillus safensis]AWI35379.1 hypothetical protein RS87_01275 [Bacillus safensis FO-36b]KDE26384.1 ABC transporter permease [Bacillus safensis FO-36b]MCM3050061.1 ABC transporter permease [Bacillus safensis]MCM3451613.1 ABC transporter permease [Bacillus safensis]MDR6683973.1 putative ABC transport system permease protein [Bacillus safensis]
MFLDNFRMAYSSIMAHKLRTILTMLGIIIGISSILLIVAIGKGGEHLLKENIIGNSDGTIGIQYLDENLTSIYDNQDTPIFEEDKLLEMKQKFQLQNVIIKNNSVELFIDDKNNDKRLNVIGVNYDYIQINSLEMINGRNIKEENFNQMQNSVYFSKNAALELYNSDDVVGKIIEIRDTPYIISGVYESDGGSLSIPEIIMPFYSWPLTFNTDKIQSVSIKTEDSNDLVETANEVAKWLNETKPTFLAGEYQIFNIKDVEKGISAVTSILTLIIGSVAGISLIVGGIGIMNMMLVTVTERTREIGLRMSLGATKGQILTQFLFESLVISFTGGIIGILLGLTGGVIVSYFTEFPVLVSVPSIILSSMLSIFIGVIFGIIPASRAARHHPSESLMYE